MTARKEAISKIQRYHGEAGEIMKASNLSRMATIEMVKMAAAAENRLQRNGEMKSGEM